MRYSIPAEIAFAAMALVASTQPATAQEQSPPDSAARPDSTPAGSPAASRSGRDLAIRSWTSDRHDYRPGDVLSVVVDERTLARAVAENRSTDRRTGEGLLDILPSNRLGLRTRNDARSEERGRTTRNERFRTRISVRVEEVTGGGVLKIQGAKRYGVGEHERKIILSGFVRPEDVSLANVVRGWRVADLRLQFSSNGKLMEPDRGLIAKAFDFLF